MKNYRNIVQRTSSGAPQYPEVSMTEDEYPLRLAAATRNPRCVGQIKLSRELSEEEGIRPGVSLVVPARCPFEVVPGTDLAGAAASLASESESLTYSAGRWGFVPNDLSSYEHGSVTADITAAKTAGYCASS